MRADFHFLPSQPFPTLQTFSYPPTFPSHPSRDSHRLPTHEFHVRKSLRRASAIETACGDRGDRRTVSIQAGNEGDQLAHGKMFFRLPVASATLLWMLALGANASCPTGRLFDSLTITRSHSPGQRANETSKNLRSPAGSRAQNRFNEIFQRDDSNRHSRSSMTDNRQWATCCTHSSSCFHDQRL